MKLHKEILIGLSLYTCLTITVSVDLKPLIEIDSDGDLYLGIDPGIGVKFTF